MRNYITKGQAISQIREAIDATRKSLRFAVGEERAWDSGIINGLQDALVVVQAIDSLDEVPDEDAPPCVQDAPQRIGRV